MPYTPPSRESPASSRTTSPTISRNHSYTGDIVSSPSRPQRPQLPRSISSTSYLQKHRRTPSIQKKDDSQACVKTTDARARVYGRDGLGSLNSGSVRQSPPPVTHGLMPSGAVVSPPESLPSSDDDDGSDRKRRQFGDLAELHEALRSSIDVKREHSPSEEEQMSTTESKATGSALTPEARKISHSRSSSEMSLSTKVADLARSTEQASDDSDLDDDELQMKPPLLRKKSGELVKPALRPPSRRRPSSMPGTPTFSKAVHFNDDIEQVRHFLQVDRPIAVSAGSSPVETYDSEPEYPFGSESSQSSRPTVEWEIRLANFPRDTLDRKVMPVRVEKIVLSADYKTLVGSVAVANLAYHKLVVARFTLDYWKTTSEVVAEYNDDVRKKFSNDGMDRFTFNIKLADQAHLETKTLLLCVRYNVNGQEYWDNNGSMNYQVDFTKKVKPRNAKDSTQAIGARPVGSIPRSRHSAPGSRPRPRSMPVSFDDDFAGTFGSKFEFGSGRVQPNDTSNSPLRLKNQGNMTRGRLFPEEESRKLTGSGSAFSTRYDFGASLSAALSNAQKTLASGVKPKKDEVRVKANVQASPAPVKSNAPAVADVPKPAALSADKPDLKSAEYNELIQKYCFFGSSKGSPQPSSGKDVPQTDGVREEEVVSDCNLDSIKSSGSSTPSPPRGSPQSRVESGDDQRNGVLSHSPFLSRSTSPGSVTGSAIGPRSESPLNFGYPYRNKHGGIFPESQTPQAIQG